MSAFYRRFSRAPSYMRSFGMRDGLRLWLDVERTLYRPSNRMRAVRVNWAKGPVWLRDTVSDHAIFWQCMVKQQYDIGRFPHCKRLTDACGRISKEGHSPLIIDCGGNIGLSVIWFALKFPGAQVLAPEPEEN